MPDIVFATSIELMTWLVDTGLKYLNELKKAKQEPVGKAIEKGETKTDEKQAKQSGKREKPGDGIHEIMPVFGKYVTRNREFAKKLVQVRDIVFDYATRARVERPLNILPRCRARQREVISHQATGEVPLAEDRR
jgi:hypothetical protein